MKMVPNNPIFLDYVFYTHCSNQIVPNRPKWFQNQNFKKLFWNHLVMAIWSHLNSFFLVFNLKKWVFLFFFSLFQKKLNFFNLLTEIYNFFSIFRPKNRFWNHLGLFGTKSFQIDQMVPKTLFRTKNRKKIVYFS